MLEGAFNTDTNGLNEFIKTYKPSFPVELVDPRFILEYAQITEGMRPTVPVMFFIDRTGTIRSQYFGTDAFLNPDTVINEHVRAEIDHLLAEKPPAAKKGAAKKR